MLALLVRSDTCISYAAPNHLLGCFYASPGTFLLRNRVVHLCIIHTSSMHRPCLIYPTSMCRLRVSPMSHPGYHCHCIFYASSMCHVCTICASCIQLEAMCHLCILYVTALCHPCFIYVSSLHLLCIIYVSPMHHICIIYMLSM